LLNIDTIKILSNEILLKNVSNVINNHRYPLLDSKNSNNNVFGVAVGHHDNNSNVNLNLPSILDTLSVIINYTTSTLSTATATNSSTNTSNNFTINFNDDNDYQNNLTKAFTNNISNFNLQYEDPQIPFLIKWVSMLFCILIMVLGVVGNVMVSIICWPFILYSPLNIIFECIAAVLFLLTFCTNLCNFGL
jgi:hypothetical protein